MSEFRKTVPSAPLHEASAVLIVLADWVVFGLNIVTTLRAYWLIDACSALGAGILVALIERRYSMNSRRNAALKGGASAAIVALPLPLMGTAVALAALGWAWMSSLSRQD